MSDGVWRNFRFFESEALPAAAALAELNVVCTCLTPTSLVVGDYEGQVFFLARHKSDTAAATASRWCFQAYAGPVTHVRYCAQRNALLTIGDDDALNTTILRVWDLDQLAALYKALLDHHPSAATAAATTGSPTSVDAAASASLRWRPPCQEHRLPPAARAAAVVSTTNSSGSSAAAAAATAAPHPTGEEMPLVPILLDEARQLQYHFKPTTATLAGSTSAAAPSPPPPSSGSGTAAAAATAAGVVSCGSIRSAVVSFDVAADMSCAAVGLVTRECVVLKGDLAKERAVRVLAIRSGIAKGALTFVGLPSPACVALPESKGTGATEGDGGSGSAASSAFSLLTGGSGRGAAGVSSSAAAASPAAQVLFTVFEDVVTCWALRARGTWSEYPCPIPGGAPRFGAALNAHGELLLLARHATAGSAAAHLAAASAAGAGAAGSRVVRLGGATAPYDPTSKSSVHTIEVDHVPGRCFLYAHRQYLALLVQHDGRPEQYQLQCFDLTYRIRGLTRPQEAYLNCAVVLGDGADLLVLFLDPSVRTRQLTLRGVRLRETDTQTKLELLFSKECYGIAQQLAQTMDGADPTLQLRIRKRYGDYLYGKGKLDEAMTQYVDTIGHLESSYVIRRYMGSAQMEQLIRYLEELHNQRHSGHANVAHTTLLLTCYSKQQDEARLDAFIHRDDVRFDAKNAIEVCREGGYAAAALYLADRYAAVHDCARIRLYDMQAPLETLVFVRTLGVDEAEAIVAELGKDLLRAAPRATTELLMELCVYWRGPGRRLVEPTAGGSAMTATTTTRAASSLFSGTAGLTGGGEPRHPHRANASAFLPIFVDTPVCLMNFLRAVVASGVLDEEERGQRAAPPANDAQAASSSAAPAGAAAPALGPHAVLYNTLLELFMTRELKNTLQLVPSHPRGFSAGDGARQRGQARDAALLSATGDFPPEPYERRLEQARTFLEAYKGRYDHHLALSLAHQHCFQDGILYLLRSLGLSEEILSYYSAKLSDAAATSAERHEAAAKLLEACRESPASDSSTAAMWMTLLAQLVRSPTSDWLDVVKVLDYIEAHDALPPVVVLEILSNNPHSALDLRTVRDYCQRCLQRQSRQVREVQAQTAQRLGEVERVKQDVVALQTSAVVFQSTTCAHCHQALDTPAVYFMCKHAFHHRCLYAPTECNVCAVAHRRRLEAIHEAEQRDLQRQDPSSFTAQFFQAVKRGRTAPEEGSAAGAVQDSFGVVTDYIARGVLGAPPLYKDAGLFGYESAVPLRPSEGRHVGAEEEAVRADDLDVW